MSSTIDFPIVIDESEYKISVRASGHKYSYIHDKYSYIHVA